MSKSEETVRTSFQISLRQPYDYTAVFQESQSFPPRTLLFPGQPDIFFEKSE